MSAVYAINPRVFEVYDVSREPGGGRDIELRAADGSKWFRSATPALDFGDIDFQRMSRAIDESGLPAISLMVDARAKARFVEWSRRNDGQACAIMIDGQLHSIDRIAAGSAGLLIRGFGGNESVDQTIENMRNGGTTSHGQSPE